MKSGTPKGHVKFILQYHRSLTSRHSYQKVNTSLNTDKGLLVIRMRLSFFPQGLSFFFFLSYVFHIPSWRNIKRIWISPSGSYAMDSSGQDESWVSLLPLKVYFFCFKMSTNMSDSLMRPTQSLKVTEASPPTPHPPRFLGSFQCGGIVWRGFLWGYLIITDFTEELPRGH